MIDGLRSSGIDVQECNVPLKLSTAERVKILRQPWRLPVLGGKIMLCWLRLTKRSRQVSSTDAVIVGHLGQFDIHLARWLFPRKLLALDYMISGSDTAKDRHLSGGLKDKLLVWLDNRALAAANLVILDTEEHKAALPDTYRDKSVVVHVGAPQQWFDAAKYPRDTHRPVRIIFFGAYTPLQGAPVIGQAIGRLNTPVAITMVGTGQDEAATKRAVSKNKGGANVTWIDWIESAKLPEVVAEHDICLGVFGTGPKAFRVVPNKVYQGAAVGCAIITSDTPPQRRVLQSGTVLVPYGDAEVLAAAIEDLARHPKKLLKLRQAAYRLGHTSFTPHEITRPLAARIKREVSAATK